MTEIDLLTSLRESIERARMLRQCDFVLAPSSEAAHDTTIPAP